MAFSIKYSKSRRMIVSGLSCDCPFDHRTITQDIYIGSGVLAGLPAMIKRRDMGKRLVLVADENTYPDCGERTRALLCEEGYQVVPLVVDARAIADERYVGQALLTMRMDTDFFVSVGAGAVSDITRIVASQTERPLAVVATAPSTTAYPSLIGEALLNGFVSNVKAVNPEIVLCDMDIIKKAPRQSVAAGFAEMMSKYLSIADWRLRRLISCEKLCPTYAQAVMFAADRALAASDDIAEGSAKGLETLMESLILTGLIIALTGSTRAVESAEYAMAEYMVMDYVRRNADRPAFGYALAASVGAALEGIDALKILDDPNRALTGLAGLDFEGEIIYGFGPMAQNVAELWPDTSPAYLERQVQAFVKRFSSVKNALGEIPDTAKIVEAMRKVGCFEGNIPQDLVDRARIYAPYLMGGFSLVAASRLCRV